MVAIVSAVRKPPFALIRLDRAGNVVDTNSRFTELVGYTPAEVPDLHAWWLLAFPDPCYRKQVKADWAAAVQESIACGTDVPTREYRVTCKNGQIKTLLTSTLAVSDGVLAILDDITECQHAEEIQRQLMRELRAISECNQALMRAEDEQTLLDEVTRIICKDAGYRAAVVAYAETDAAQTLKPVAWAGVDEAYFADAKLTWADRELGRGPLGTSIRTASIVEIADINTDPRMQPWREKALQHGFRSVVALPLKDDQQTVLGGLLIYSGKANAIRPEEIRLLDELAGDLAFGINNLRARYAHRQAEAQLVASEHLFRAMVENSPDLIIRYDRNLRRTYLNPAIRKIFIAPMDQVIGEPPKVRSPLHDPVTYTACLQRVVDTAQEQSAELSFSEITGETRWASMRFVPELGTDGEVSGVLTIAHDITTRKQSEQARQAHLHFLESLDRVNRAIQAANDLDQMMSDVLDVVLDIFDCDRAYLEYPCDPDAAEWWIPMERCKPAYPSPLAAKQRVPMDAHIQAAFRTMLDTSGPVCLGPGTALQIPIETTERLGVRSLMAMALHPKSDRPWQFGIHQCSHERIWTVQEERLLEEIGRRVSDGLSALVVNRNLRESEERFRLVFENSPLPIWEEDFSAVKTRLDELMNSCGGDLENWLLSHPEVLRECAQRVRVVDINRAALALHEANNKEGLLQGLVQTFIPETYEAFRHELIGLTRGETEMVLDSVVQTLTGQKRYVTVYFTVCPGYEQSLTKVLVSLIDITERKRSEDELRLAASVFATSQEGILISDVGNRIIDVNPAFTRLTGYSRAEVIGRNPSFLSAKQQSPDVYEAMWQDIETRGEWQGELCNKRKSGEMYTELLSIVAVKDQQDKLQHYVGVFSDISVIKQHEAELNRIAYFDTLTSVPNRRLLSDRLEQAIARFRRHGSKFAVCYLDLDGFKPINDQFGHEGGDRLLIEIARRLQAMSRADDTVARLGGDEFVLLWNDIDVRVNCTHALERVLTEVSTPVMIDGISVSVSASIGVTLFPDDNVDADTLLRHADHAMYSAKQLGKNRYQMFDADLAKQISLRVEFLAKVGRSLDSGEFELFYQPKVDCVSGKVLGVEALLRWNEPILGLLTPKEFLPLIEDDSMALRMGRWVMAEAVRQARHWHEMGIDLCISINIFPRHLKYPTFIEDLRNAVDTHWQQMPPNRLMMEIVETSDLEELAPIEAVIQECLQMGIPFSIDDFGTGYSSLIYLRRLSVQELKIDQSFVRDMLEDPEDRAIVVGVIGLGKAFGLRVVAEGVESQRHVQQLIDLGCNVAQGFGLGHPMPVAALQKWLIDRSL